MVKPLAPTQLIATAVSATEIVISFTDNSLDESGFEVSIADPAWRALTPLLPSGQLVAGTIREPVTNLQPSTLVSVRVRAIGSGAASDHSSMVSVQTFPAPTVDIFNGWSSPFADGRASIRRIVAIHDTNGDGFVRGVGNAAPQDPMSIYPRWRGGNCGAFEGSRFAPGANVIVLSEIVSGGLTVRPQFVAVHMRVAGQTVEGLTVSGGDLLANYGGVSGLIMGADQPPAFSLSGALPFGTSAGRLSGWVQAFIAASSCELAGIITGSASVRLEIHGIPIVPE